MACRNKVSKKWDFNIFKEVNEQVSIFNDIILVYINASPDLSNSSYPSEPSPSSYIRCVRLTWDKELMIHRRQKDGHVKIEKVSSYCRPNQMEQCYWGFHKIEEIFDGLNVKKDQKTIQYAIEALKGLLE